MRGARSAPYSANKNACHLRWIRPYFPCASQTSAAWHCSSLPYCASKSVSQRPQRPCRVRFPLLGRGRRRGPRHTRRLTSIRRAREPGFGIVSIRALLTAVEPGHRSCAEVQAKLADLARLEEIFADTVSRCKGDQSPTCPVLDMLDAVP